MVDGVRVDAAVRVVERQSGKQAHAGVGEQLLQDHGMRDAKIVVILVEQRSEARFCAIHQRVVMVEDARHRGRPAVAVQVDGADQ